MSQKLEIPVFLTETEEADWWYEHRDLIEGELHAASVEGRLKEGLPVPPSQRNTQTTITLNANDSKKAQAVALRRGMPYQTYLKTLIHEALEKEPAA